MTKTIVLFAEGTKSCNHDIRIFPYLQAQQGMECEVWAVYTCQLCGLEFHVQAGVIWLKYRILDRLFRGDKLLAWRLVRKEI